MSLASVGFRSPGLRQMGDPSANVTGIDLDAIAVTKRTLLGYLSLTASQVDAWVEDFNQFSTAGDSTTFGAQWIRTVGANSHVDHLGTSLLAGGVARIFKDSTVNTWEDNSLLLNGPGFPASVRSWAVNFRCKFVKLATLTDANNNIMVGMAQGSVGTLAAMTANPVALVGYAGGTSLVNVDVTVTGAGNNATTYPLATLDSVWRDITIVGLWQAANSTKVQAIIDGTKIFEATVPDIFNTNNPFLYCNRGTLFTDTIIVMWEREK